MPPSRQERRKAERDAAKHPPAPAGQAGGAAAAAAPTNTGNVNVGGQGLTDIARNVIQCVPRGEGRVRGSRTPRTGTPRQGQSHSARRVIHAHVETSFLELNGIV